MRRGVVQSGLSSFRRTYDLYEEGVGCVGNCYYRPGGIASGTLGIAGIPRGAAPHTQRGDVRSTQRDSASG